MAAAPPRRFVDQRRDALFLEHRLLRDDDGAALRVVAGVHDVLAELLHLGAASAHDGGDAAEAGELGVLGEQRERRGDLGGVEEAVVLFVQFREGQTPSLRQSRGNSWLKSCQ